MQTPGRGRALHDLTEPSYWLFPAASQRTDVINAFQVHLFNPLVGEVNKPEPREGKCLAQEHTDLSLIFKIFVPSWGVLGRKVQLRHAP